MGMNGGGKEGGYASATLQVLPPARLSPEAGAAWGGGVASRVAARRLDLVLDAGGRQADDHDRDRDRRLPPPAPGASQRLGAALAQLELDPAGGASDRGACCLLVALATGAPQARGAYPRR